MTASPQAPALRIFLVGASGTIGRATARALVRRGHSVVCFVRPGAELSAFGGEEERGSAAELQVRHGNVTDAESLVRDGLRGERFDVLVSCLASRTGAPEDAWKIDFGANATALEAAKSAGISHMILLSAICVQKPRLAFQHAKLAFEARLIGSGMQYTIVRPTAFFKSLSGQVARVQRGKPWLLFGSGELTACKPISDDDLGRYLADCIDNPDRRNRVLAIGGPGDAITPRQQAEAVFTLLGREPRFTHVPVRLMDGVVAVLAGLGRIYRPLRDKAEYARIGRYYATESMLVLDHATGRYDAAATPSTGTETLFDHYARLIGAEGRTDSLTAAMSGTRHS